MAQQKKRAAPRTDKGTLIALRLEPGLLARVDRWAASQKDDPSRPEAIRRLVELGVSIALRTGVRTEEAAKAAERARQESDPLVDDPASDEERSLRKGGLMNGPQRGHHHKRKR